MDTISVKNDNPLPSHFEEFAEGRRNGFLSMKELKDQGRNIIGTFCTYTPKEILYAAGAVPVGLCGTTDEYIPDAERDLPKNLCPLIKASYGHALTDTCPFMYFSDMVVGETTCDGKKKMYEFLGELKDMHIMMLPQTYQFESGLALYKSEMVRLIEKLEEKFGVTINDEQLAQAIRDTNEERKLLLEFLKLGKLEPAPIHGMELANVQEGYEFMFDRDERIKMIKELTELTKERYENELKDSGIKRPRILMTGGPNSGVKDKIIQTLQDAGCDTVVFDSCNGIREKLDTIDETIEPLDALSSKYMHIGCSVMTYNNRRMNDIKELAKEFHVDAIVEVVLQACHTFAIEALHVERLAKDELEIPYLKIGTDYSENDAGQIKTRIEAFVEMLD